VQRLVEGGGRGGGQRRCISVEGRKKLKGFRVGVKRGRGRKGGWVGQPRRRSLRTRRLEAGGVCPARVGPGSRKLPRSFVLYCATFPRPQDSPASVSAVLHTSTVHVLYKYYTCTYCSIDTVLYIFVQRSTVLYRTEKCTTVCLLSFGHHCLLIPFCLLLYAYYCSLPNCLVTTVCFRLFVYYCLFATLCLLLFAYYCLFAIVAQANILKWSQPIDVYYCLFAYCLCTVCLLLFVCYCLHTTVSFCLFFFCLLCYYCASRHSEAVPAHRRGGTGGVPVPSSAEDAAPRGSACALPCADEYTIRPVCLNIVIVLSYYFFAHFQLKALIRPSFLSPFFPSCVLVDMLQWRARHRPLPCPRVLPQLKALLHSAHSNPYCSLPFLLLYCLSYSGVPGTVPCPAPRVCPTSRPSSTVLSPAASSASWRATARCPRGSSRPRSNQRHQVHLMPLVYPGTAAVGAAAAEATPPAAGIRCTRHISSNTTRVGIRCTRQSSSSSSSSNTARGAFRGTRHSSSNSHRCICGSYCCNRGITTRGPSGVPGIAASMGAQDRDGGTTGPQGQEGKETNGGETGAKLGPKETLQALVQSFCTHKQVISFAWSAIRRLVPGPLLGSPLCQRRLRRLIKNFISLRRHENPSLQALMPGMTLKRLPLGPGVPPVSGDAPAVH